MIGAATAAGYPAAGDTPQLNKPLVIAALFAFILVSAGVLVLRKTRPDLPRGFRVPLVPVVPVLAILACLYLMLQLPRLTWIRFGIWLAIGLVIYLLYGIRHSRLQRVARGGER